MFVFLISSKYENLFKHIIDIMYFFLFSLWHNLIIELPAHHFSKFAQRNIKFIFI